MKILWTVAALWAVIHILGFGGMAGWMVFTDRLNGERLVRAYKMFAMTAAEEKKIAEEEQLEAERRQARDLTGTDDGDGRTGSTLEALRSKDIEDEIRRSRMSQKQAELESLQAEVQLAGANIQQKLEQLQKERDTFKQEKKEDEERLNREGFLATVAMYEKLPAKQVKEVFMKMYRNKQTDEVVQLVETMQLRKATGVMREFKARDEAEAALEIFETLRNKGAVDPAEAAEDEAANANN